MLLAQSIFKHRKVKLLLVHSIFQILLQLPQAMMYLGCYNPQSVGHPMCNKFIVELTLQKPPQLCHLCCPSICYYRQPFPLLKAIHLFHTRAKEGTVVPDSELKRQDQDATSPFPGRGFPVASHRSFNLFIFTYPTITRSFYLYYRVSVCMQFSAFKAFEDW